MGACTKQKGLLDSCKPLIMWLRGADLEPIYASRLMPTLAGMPPKISSLRSKQSG